MQAGPTKPPVAILFDGDLGNSIDSALALALLYGFDNRNEARMVAISVSKGNLKAAALADAIARYYISASWGQFAGAARTLPIGFTEDGRGPQDTPLLNGTLAARDAVGKPLFPHGIQRLTDTAEVPPLLRNACTAQHDQNAVIVLAGPATNLARLLELKGARDVIANKVRLLAVAGGAFPDSGPESHMQADPAAARKLFAEWPTPIVVAGREVGDAVRYPAASLDTDFGWAKNHPVVEAYRQAQPMPYDAPTLDLAPALYAVRPQEGYFQLSPAGTVEVLGDGRTRFSPNPEGKHRYLILKPDQKEKVLRAYSELVSTQPVPRRPRFLQQDQDKDKDEKKPAAKTPEPKPIDAANP